MDRKSKDVCWRDSVRHRGTWHHIERGRRAFRERERETDIEIETEKQRETERETVSLRD